MTQPSPTPSTVPFFPKITIIGAGGFVFPFRLIADLVSFPALRSSTLVLMDLDAERVHRTATAARRSSNATGFGATMIETTDRREALREADFVIITFQVGGVDPTGRMLRSHGNTE